MKLRSTEPRRIQPHAADILGAEPAAELVFDPERDITEEDWQRMLQQMNQFKGNNWANYLRFPTPMILLAPERRGELELNEEAWESLKYGMGHYDQSKYPSGRVTSIGEFFDLAVVFPERRAELPLEMLWDYFLKDFENRKQHSADEAVILLLLAPERRKEIPLPANYWTQIKDMIDKDQTEARRATGRRFDQVPGLVMAAKLLFPDYPVTDLGSFEVEMGRHAKQLKEERRAGNYIWFPDTLERLLLFSADKIWFTPEGELKIQKPTSKSAISQGRALPERPEV
ncbi:MAG: hypothetical protein AAB558_02200 [Patescibacteria group bacterium]